MFDIITFGSATRDNFLKLNKENYRIIESDKFLAGQGLCFSKGSKNEINDLCVSIGGGGINTAVTFASQGLKVACVGKIGEDKRGEAIIDGLKKFKVSTKFLKKDKKNPTAFSLILSSKEGERTIFVYRGAANYLKKNEISWKDLKAKWFYLAPFSGELSKLTEPLINFAKKNNMKVAFNPGYNQLKFSLESMKRILSKVDVLILNQEEASMLTRIPYQQEEEIFKKIDVWCKGILIMTKGEAGVVVSDGQYLYRASSLTVKAIDGTGAGDAFGSGFISGIIKKNNIIYAIQLGIANSTSCIKKTGAIDGLLKKGQKWQKIKVIKESCSKSGKCQVKN
jgi:ribokinase